MIRCRCCSPLPVLELESTVESAEFNSKNLTVSREENETKGVSRRESLSVPRGARFRVWGVLGLLLLCLQNTFCSLLDA